MIKKWSVIIGACAVDTLIRITLQTYCSSCSNCRPISSVPWEHGTENHFNCYGTMTWDFEDENCKKKYIVILVFTKWNHFSHLILISTDINIYSLLHWLHTFTLFLPWLDVKKFTVMDLEMALYMNLWEVVVYHSRWIYIFRFLPYFNFSFTWDY